MKGPFVCVDDYETFAAAHLPKQVYDYYRSGADDQITLRSNISAFKQFEIRPRVLRDVSKRDLTTTILNGRFKLRSPIGIAPTASQRLAHPDGEIATARAASARSALLIVSTIATTSLEEVASVEEDSIRWFQLYVYKDRKLTESLVSRAEQAGYTALVLTVDTPVAGNRRNDARNGFTLPPHLKMANFASANKNDARLLAVTTQTGNEASSGFSNYVNSLFDPSLSWKDVDWLRSITKLPIILKGILTEEDAIEAVKHGASAIIVSNHGGRQLDSCSSTLNALPEVVHAVDGQCDIYLDGEVLMSWATSLWRQETQYEVYFGSFARFLCSMLGIRTGTDVFKALALGAKMVFVGRPVLWALAANGQSGVLAILDLLNEEFDRCMALTGCRSVSEIKPEYIQKAAAFRNLGSSKSKL